MKELAYIFKISLAFMLFMCGLITGRETKEKDYRERLVTEEELLYKEPIAEGAEGITVYFDHLGKGTINLIVRNNTGNKLQEVSIVDLEINGKQIDSYSFLDGIHSGETKECVVTYDIDMSDGTIDNMMEVKGNLCVRGSGNLFYRKIYITGVCQL